MQIHLKRTLACKIMGIILLNFQATPQRSTQPTVRPKSIPFLCLYACSSRKVTRFQNTVLVYSTEVLHVLSQ